MKTFICCLLSLWATTIYAQDPQLFENTWFLQEVIIDGTSYPTPNNKEINQVTADFFSPNAGEEFTTLVCNSASGIDVIYNNPNSTFSFPNGLGITLIVCNLTENIVFEEQYFQNFFFTNDIAPFLYEIISSGNSKQLTLTAVNGDQAIYSSELLATNDVYLTDVVVYPNPVATEIKMQTNTTIQEIMLFDVLGNSMLTHKNIATTNFTLDVSTLKSGLYFAQIKDRSGKTQIVRFVKQ